MWRLETDDHWLKSRQVWSASSSDMCDGSTGGGGKLKIRARCKIVNHENEILCCKHVESVKGGEKIRMSVRFTGHAHLRRACWTSDPSNTGMYKMIVLSILLLCSQIEERSFHRLPIIIKGLLIQQAVLRNSWPLTRSSTRICLLGHLLGERRTPKEARWLEKIGKKCPEDTHPLFDTSVLRSVELAEWACIQQNLTKATNKRKRGTNEWEAILWQSHTVSGKKRKKAHMFWHEKRRAEFPQGIQN
jgi:hypothetical protein